MYVLDILCVSTGNLDMRGHDYANVYSMLIHRNSATVLSTIHATYIGHRQTAPLPGTPTTVRLRQ
jgi:hypothetical protein